MSTPTPTRPGCSTSSTTAAADRRGVHRAVPRARPRPPHASLTGNLGNIALLGMAGEPGPDPRRPGRRRRRQLPNTAACSNGLRLNNPALAAPASRSPPAAGRAAAWNRGFRRPRPWFDLGGIGGRPGQPPARRPTQSQNKPPQTRTIRRSCANQSAHRRFISYVSPDPPDREISLRRPIGAAPRERSGRRGAPIP